MRSTLTSLVAAFETADERGGELRDKLIDLWNHDDRLRAVRQRGETIWTRVGAKLSPPVPATKTTAVAPATVAPTAVAPAAAPTPTRNTPKPLGNPDRAAQIYGRDSCLWTGRAKAVLERNNVSFDYIDVTTEGGDALLARLTSECKQRTVPFVFVRGKFIGGFNALSELDRLGHLEVALMTPEEYAAAPAHVRATVVEPRPETDDD